MDGGMVFASCKSWAQDALLREVVMWLLDVR